MEGTHQDALQSQLYGGSVPADAINELGFEAIVENRRASVSPSASGSGTEGSGFAGPTSHPLPGTAATNASNKPIRRRMRMITSCLECRRRKLKCNKSQPCTNCVKFDRDCVYIGPKLDEASQLRLTEIKEKVGSLERALERDVAKNANTRSTSHQDFLVDELDYSPSSGDLELGPTDIGPAEIRDNERDVEDAVDLGIQIGRVRVTSRMDGISWSRIVAEIYPAIFGRLSTDQQEQRPASMAGGLEFMNRLGALPTTPSPASARGELPDFMHPSSSYIQPSNNILFGQSMNVPSLEAVLPPRAAADCLIGQYFRAVHPIARCVHRPTFDDMYHAFWNEICANLEPRASTQAVIFAAMFSGAVSLTNDTLLQEVGVDRRVLIEDLKLAAEAALSRASFLRSTKFETLQALVMYLIPLCRAEVSRAHSVLVGAAMRMAECMGVHRDGENIGLSMVETHVRRLVWHQLCFLDIRTAEAQGPRPFIRREDYDTRLPLNCDDGELLLGVAPPESETCCTPVLLSLIRFEINEMMRVLWVDRRKLEKQAITLTEVLAKTENFRRRMLEKYDHALNNQVSIQRYARLVMHLLLYRLYIIILGGYHSDPRIELPSRLNNVVVMAGIMIIEISIQLENDATFADWAWYFGAYSQHHAAILLATEIYYQPQSREAPRISACLDYVFNLDREIPLETKGLHVLREIMTKTATYQRLRRSNHPKFSRLLSSQQTQVAIMSDESQNAVSQMCPYYVPARIRAGTPPSPLGGPSLPNSFGRTGMAEAVWASMGRDSPEAPGGSEAGSPSSGGTRFLPLATRHSEPGIMLEKIDWDTLNALFPPDPNTGEINLAGYHDPTITLNWQQWK